MYKAGYKNPNSNSDSFTYFKLLHLYGFSGIRNPATTIIPIFNISFHIRMIFHIPMTLVIPQWDLKTVSLRLSYDMDLHIYTFNTVQILYCVIFNNHTSCDWDPICTCSAFLLRHIKQSHIMRFIHLTKKIVPAGIYISYWYIGMSKFSSSSCMIDSSTCHFFPSLILMLVDLLVYQLYVIY